MSSDSSMNQAKEFKAKLRKGKEKVKTPFKGMLGRVFGSASPFIPA